MIFSSPIFLFIFLPFVLAVFGILKRFGRSEWLVYFLIAASLVFYAFWKVALLAVILLSIAVNYMFSHHLGEDQKHRKALLVVGIAFNLGLLFYFKYRNFFLENVCQFAGCNTHWPELILPLGISFFTFQQIAYLVDRYKEKQDHTSFSEYALFVCFFPQLIAGPIVHHNEILPQLRKLKEKIPEGYIWRGITIFSIGLFKKVVIADQLGVSVEKVFGNAETGAVVTFADAWIGALSYTLQLYFDFSAYSDMAIGIAMLFGVILPINFNSPYKARNIRDFWQRWHITLTRFLKEHVYIPLGGNRAGAIKLYRNLLLTMLIGGLWHGAAWTFVIWGSLHGAVLCLHRLVSPLINKVGGLAKIFRFGLGQSLTILFVVVAWVVFRADSMDSASVILQSMVNFNDVILPNGLEKDRSLPYLIRELPFIGYGLTALDAEAVKAAFWCLPALFVAVFALPNSWQLVGIDNETCLATSAKEKRIFNMSLLKGNWITVLFVALLLTVSLMFIDQPAEFLYFDF